MAGRLTLPRRGGGNYLVVGQPLGEILKRDGFLTELGKLRVGFVRLAENGLTVRLKR